MNYYILASQTGTGHAGTEGDPWTYNELVSTIRSPPDMVVVAIEVEANNDWLLTVSV